MKSCEGTDGASTASVTSCVARRSPPVGAVPVSESTGRRGRPSCTWPLPVVAGAGPLGPVPPATVIAPNTETSVPAAASMPGPAGPGELLPFTLPPLIALAADPYTLTGLLETRNPAPPIVFPDP